MGSDIVTFDPKAFVQAIMKNWRENDCSDIDGEVMQALFIDHGLLVERSLTKEECGQDSAVREWGAGPGDTWLFPRDEYKAWLDE